MQRSHVFFSPTVRAILLGLTVVVGTPGTWAQTPPAPSASATQGVEQKTERISHEDAGSRIEELRVGGQTRSIDVQTNTAVPAYQVKPLDTTRPADGSGAPTEGKSSWRLLNF